MSGLHPIWQGGDLGFLVLRWRLDDCAKTSNALPYDKPIKRINAPKDHAIDRQNDTAYFKEPQKRCACVRLMMARGRRVGVFAQGVRIPFGEDFHHPAIKIIDGVIHDWFEAAVVFSMCFFNVVFQSDAEISILAAEAHLLRSEHFNV